MSCAPVRRTACSSRLLSSMTRTQTQSVPAASSRGLIVSAGPVLRCLADHIQRFQHFFTFRQGLAPGQGGDYRQHEGGIAHAEVTLDNG